jgi:hypothetical protein
MIGVLGFDSQWGLGIFLFIIASRTALGPIQTPIQWVPGALSLGEKRLGCEADHSPPSSAEVKNAWSYTSTQYAFMVWCLVKKKAWTSLLCFTFMSTVEVIQHQIICEERMGEKTLWPTSRYYHGNFLEKLRLRKTTQILSE